MKEDNMDFLIDDKSLKRAYKKAKVRSTVRTIVIVILVTIPLYIIFNKINTRIMYKAGTQYYDEIQKILDITEPNAYISSANDTIGIFGASGSYTVSKIIGRTPIELYSRSSRYGLAGSMEPNRAFTISAGGGSVEAGEWPVNFDESGNLLMMAFHPDIAYKEYKNDLASVDKLSADSMIEMTLSLDKKYKSYEIMSILPEANIYELLIDGYSEEEMNTYRTKAKEYDGTASYIPEREFVRLGFRSAFNHYPFAGVSEKYKELLNNLQFDYKYNAYVKARFRSVYSTLKARYQLDASKVDIIGVVVYGTPEELQKLKSNPHIKASSAGIVTRDIIFK